LFASNLRHLLLTPPLAQYLDAEASAATATATATASSQTIVVCGIDPGYAHGHKVSLNHLAFVSLCDTPAYFSEKNNALFIFCSFILFEYTLISPFNHTHNITIKTITKVVVLAFPLLVASAKPEVLCCTKLFASSRSSGEQMAELLAKHKVQVVAIGNGTASREAQVRVLTSGSVLMTLSLLYGCHVFNDIINDINCCCTYYEGYDERGSRVDVSPDFCVCVCFGGPEVSSGSGERGGRQCLLGVCPG
jgi:hypothetical protein